MKQEVEKIYNQNINNSEKIERLKELLLDCLNEMEAQDQNMHPEVRHKLAEGYRIAKNYIRELEGKEKNTQ